MTSALPLLSLLLPAAAQDVELVSRAAASSAVLPARFVDASADARFVLVSSEAPNVLPGQVDPTDSSDLFLVDRTAGTTALVTHRGDQVTASSAGATLGAVSEDGRTVVFLSGEVGLVAGFDSLGNRQAYAYDAATGSVTPLTRSAAQPNQGGNGDTDQISMDAAGRIAAVRSRATDLVPGFVDGGAGPDAFAYLLATGAPVLVSRDAANPNLGSGPLPPTNSSGLTDVFVSRDGSHVTFSTSATNVLAGYSNPGPFNPTGVYLTEIATGTVTLVNRRAGQPTTVSEDSGEFLGMTPDASRVLLRSGGDDLDPGEPFGFTRGLYLFDRAPGTNSFIAGDVSSARISDDGGRIVLASGRDAVNLLAGADDQNSRDDLFVHDVAAGAIVAIVNHDAGQPLVTPFVGSLGDWTLDATGTRVAFAHSAESLLAGYSSPSPVPVSSTFVRDLTTGGLELLSRDAGAPLVGADRPDAPSFISADGSVVLRGGRAGNLDSGPVGPLGALYASFGGLPGVPLLTAGGPISATADAPTDLFQTTGLFGDVVPRRTMSADGRYVIVDTEASNLIPGAAPYSFGAAYLVDRATGSVRLVNHRGDELTPTATLQSLNVSADGSTVVFAASGFDDLVPGLADSGSRITVFAMDTATGAVEALSSSALNPGTVSNLNSFDPTVSDDGRYVVYLSGATDLVPGTVDTGTFADVFLVDRQTGTRTLVTRAAGTNRAADRFSSRASISPDGSTVVFDSEARDLVPGFQDRSSLGGDVFAYDVASGVNRLVSHLPGAPLIGGDQASEDARVAAGVIVFESRASDLVPGFAPSFSNARHLYWSGPSSGIAPVARSANDPTTSPGGFTENPILSRDGSSVIFESTALDVVPGFVDRNGIVRADLYHADLASGAITLLGHAAGQTTVGSNSEFPFADLSDDGRRVLLVNRSTDVVPNQAQVGYADQNAFVIDLDLGTAEVLARPAGSAETEGPLTAELSGDGRSLLVSIDDPSFVANDLNTSPDVLLFDVKRPCVGTSICDGAVNSTGRAGELCMSGSDVAALDVLTAEIDALPPQTFGLLVVSTGFGFVPNPAGSQGDLCIDGAGLSRYSDDVFDSGPAGRASIDLDLSRIPSGTVFVAAMAGATYNWQAWYRDVVGGAQTSNFTGARSVLFR
ncbi:MAG: hypothetical protein AAFR54_04140 [Planctomycetota bacterium]